MVCRADIGVAFQEAQLRLVETGSDVDAGTMAIHHVFVYAAGVFKDTDHGPCVWRQEPSKPHDVTGSVCGHEQPQRKKRKKESNDRTKPAVACIEKAE
jgi:hypothetical protein